MKRKPHPNYSGNPNVALTGIEYLLLKMQTVPGQSKRYYLKQKNIYQHGSDYSNGGNGMTGYFHSKGSYDDYWVDVSKQNVSYRASNYGWLPKLAYKSKCAKMHLTGIGWRRANKIRKKIGLEPVDFPKFLN